MKKSILTLTSLLLTAGLNMLNAQDWTIIGNAGTDPNINFIGTTDNKAFRIKTNNGIRMHIKTNGDIGVGTTAPTSKLDVNGVITATGGTSTNWNTAFGWGNHAAAGYLTSFNELDPQVGANVLNRIPRWDGTALVNGSIFDNGTRIGIGTAAPLFTLHANSSTELRTVYIENSTNSASTTFGIYAGASGAGAGDKRAASFDAIGGTGTNIGIRTTATGGALNYAAYFAAGDVYSAGRVGIGITTPSYALHVSTTADLRAGYFNNTFNSASTTYGVYANNTTPGAGSGYGVYGSASGAGGSNYGVRGFASGGSANYAVYGLASGGSATTPAYGVYGTASGSAETWAGYFNGTTYATTLRVGTQDAATGYIISVGGKIITEEVRVELEANWPDYVFEKNHNLMSLDELDKFIVENKHLPNMPSACEVEEKGHHLGEVQVKLVEKTEENTLYILQLKKEIEELKNEIISLKK